MRDGQEIWSQVVKATAHALSCRALQPIATECETVEDGGAQFCIRVIAQLTRKPRSTGAPASPKRSKNPFLPYDPDLFVAGLSDTHVCLLNKYNVVPHHSLIVTREFEHQETLLSVSDFEALWRCLLDYESLGFYNSGEVSGASQPHKHLQVIPTPLCPDGRTAPLEPLIEACLPNDESAVQTDLPFRHLACRISSNWLETPAHAARQTSRAYREMLKKTDGLGGLDLKPAPYNLLISRRWMLLVPRRVERFHAISINAMGMVGAMLAPNLEAMQRLQQHGPMAALRHVTFSRES